MAQSVIKRLSLNALRASEKSQWSCLRARQPLLCERRFHVSRIMAAEQEDNAQKEKPTGKQSSFRGQLYGSTARRLAHERSEEGRFAREVERRNPQPVMRTVVLSFCMLNLATS